MVNFFKKATKDVGSFFKKGGQGSKILQKAASGIGSGAKVLGEVATGGEKILSQVEKSPFGAVLQPVTSVARAGLGGIRTASEIGYLGKAGLRSAQSGNIKGTLEKAKQIQQKGQGLRFM